MRVRPAADRASVALKRDLRVDAERVLVLMALRDIDTDADILRPGARVRLDAVSFEVDRQLGALTQAWVSVADLPALATDARVRGLRAPAPLRHFTTSEGVALMGVDALHDAGVRGQGVTIGILDGSFGGYDALLGTELPASIATESFMSGGDIYGDGNDHGTVVAEIVHDVAPDAALIFANAGTLVEVDQAISWLRAFPVDLIVSSVGSELWEPLDGRGAVAQAASAASLGGAPFFAAAGNSGNGHFRSNFVPLEIDADIVVHDFGDGAWLTVFGPDDENCYLLPAGFPIEVSLIWDDWGADLSDPGTGADYDLTLMWLNEAEESWDVAAQSKFNQAESGGPPVELVQYDIDADHEGCYGVVVRQFSATRNHDIQLYTHTTPLAPSVNVASSSLVSPCVGEHVLCVGATTLDDEIAPYSSQGPSIPSEITGLVLDKPDFTAPSGVSTASTAPDPFSGTSASAPHAGGAYALFLQSTEGGDPQAITLMRQNALDLGDPGYDHQFGWGRVRLVSCEDTGCDDGLDCTTDVCVGGIGCQYSPNAQGCWIDGGCVADGTVNPQNDCQICDEMAPIAWSRAFNNQPCEDGLFCSDGDSCQDGVCQGGPQRDCSGMSSACATGSCDEAGDACEAVALEDLTACSDDDEACTMDVCKAGACVHEPVLDGSSCDDDGNTCTADACQAGACTHTALANGLPCEDDENSCTGDYCQEGACAHLVLMDGTSCDEDGLDCTADTCASGSCEHALTGGCLIAGSCVAEGSSNPGNPCELCDQADPESWTPTGDGGACDDGLFCTYMDSCQAGSCVSGGPRDCGGASDSCNTGLCDETEDACVAHPLTDGTSCGDGGGVCALDRCAAGLCQRTAVASGTPCGDDGLECTADLCLDGVCGHPLSSGCLIDGACVAVDERNPGNDCEVCAAADARAWTALADDAACEDGFYCTEGDACASGSCEAGEERDCSTAADACNTAACDDELDECVAVPVSDGSSCRDDSDACTTDACVSGACAHLMVADDCEGRVCGASTSGCHDCGTCAEGFGCNALGSCDDLCQGVECGACQACSNGSCQAVSDGAACPSDANSCTQDTCVSGACVHEALADDVACDDEDLCTTLDLCAGGVCVGGEPVLCTASDACHGAGTCDPASGACSTPPLEDGTSCADDALDCTADTCTAGLCVHELSEACLIDGLCVAPGAINEANSCERCDPGARVDGWTALPDGDACEDGLFCTADDQCQAGLCVGGSPTDCTASADSCNSATCSEDLDACVATPLATGAACDDDANECTLDVCEAGSCTHPAVTDGFDCLDDGYPCTADRCAAGLCTHPILTGCLIEGACVSAGELHPVQICLECDSAAPSEWSPTEDGNACDDGLFCSEGDACLAGACVGQSPMDCSGSGSACSPASCDEESDSCLAEPLPEGSACDDGDACTSAETCQGGACVAVEVLGCDPAGPCELPGVCDPQTGACGYEAKPDDTACEADGHACTADVCAAGACIHRVTGGCFIDGQCLDEGAENPGAACSLCRGSSPYGWSVAPDGSPCDDGLFCTTNDSCLDATCQGGAENKCSGTGGSCRATACDEEADACTWTPEPEGATCDDALGCADGLLVFADLCDGQGSCVDSGSTPCAPYAGCADDLSCMDHCATDEDCADGSLCADESCRGNDAPVAHGGAGQVVDEGSEVTLDGRLSSDPDGDPLSFSWTQVEGPAVTLDDLYSDSPSFPAPTVLAATILVFELVVEDAWSMSPPAQTTVTVTNTVNEAPVADAGEDFSVAGEEPLVHLDGSGSSDPNGDPITFLWTQESGPGVDLDDASGIAPSFQAPVLDEEGQLVFKLIVNDGGANSEPAMVTVTVSPGRPVADPAPVDAWSDGDSDADSDGEADAVPEHDVSDDSEAVPGAGGGRSTSGSGGCAVSSTQRSTSALPYLILSGILGAWIRRGREPLRRPL